MKRISVKINEETNVVVDFIEDENVQEWIKANKARFGHDGYREFTSEGKEIVHEPEYELIVEDANEDYAKEVSNKKLVVEAIARLDAMDFKGSTVASLRAELKGFMQDIWRVVKSR